MEQLLLWSAVALYGIGALSDMAGVLARREKLILPGTVLALLGFAANFLAVAVRWMENQRPPFFSISETISSAVCIGVLIYLLVQLWDKRLRSAGVFVLPVSFLLLGWAGTLMLGEKAVEAGVIPPNMQSYWLWVHITSSAVGFGALLIAAGIALLFLLKGKYSGGIYDKLPEPERLDDLCYRFISVGFVMLAVMIVAGAFWSNQVHGTYWGWDPVEVWSLISWLVYGIYLHLRTTMGWRGQRLAWYALAAFVVMMVSLWGIPFVVQTFHAGFRIEH